MPSATPTHSERFVSRLTRNSLALVLAGGRGSRLRELTTWRSKPAVPFGGKFRIIDFTLSNCVNSGIRRIGILTQYKAHSLIHHVQKGWGFLSGQLGEFLELLPASQQITEAAWYSGTADAVFQNLHIIKNHGPKYVVVLAGDHIYKMDYGQMLAWHVENEADLTVGCIEVPIMEAPAFGVMSIDNDHRIHRFSEKPSDPEPAPGREDVALASMGIYVFDAKFLYEQLIKDADTPSSHHDFGADIIPSLLGNNRVFAFPFTDTETGKQAYWRDVGTIDAFWLANMELIEPMPELDIYDEEWPIWTHQEQLPPAKFIYDDEDHQGLAINSMVSGGCIIQGAMVRRSLLFSNVRVRNSSNLKECVALPNVSIGKNCQINRAVIDSNCRITDGTSIGMEPEQDRERYHVSPGGIVLVTPDMLGQTRYDVR